MRPQPPRTEGSTGVRRLLLTLLLPCLTVLLFIDSYIDFQDRIRSVDAAYDEALLEPLSALSDSLEVKPGGGLGLSTALPVQAMFESLIARHKYLHVGATPLDGEAAPEHLLLGSTDLPPPPSSSLLQPAPPSLGLGTDAFIAFYDANYRDKPMRVAMLERRITDAKGRPWLLRIHATEGNNHRQETFTHMLGREILQDVRLLVAVLVVVWLGVAWSMRPLERLRRDVLASAPGELRQLEMREVPREVAPLVKALNQHIAEHRELLEHEQQLLADASHQLRTPLAIMMTQAGYALRESDPQVLRETLQAMVAQLARSKRLSDQLLAMAHAGRHEAEAEPIPLVDLDATAREVLLQHLPLAREKKVDLGWATDSAEGQPMMVRASPAEVHEVLANLLHNAIRHTPAGCNITVSTRVRDGQAVAAICDEGPGIAAERREAVFDRFRRGTSSEGAGLGLAIARAYARRNGGDIVLADAGNDRSGLCASLVLPLADDAA